MTKKVLFSLLIVVIIITLFTILVSKNSNQDLGPEENPTKKETKENIGSIVLEKPCFIK